MITNIAAMRLVVAMPVVEMVKKINSARSSDFYFIT